MHPIISNTVYSFWCFIRRHFKTILYEQLFESFIPHFWSVQLVSGKKRSVGEIVYRPQNGWKGKERMSKIIPKEEYRRITVPLPASTQTKTLKPLCVDGILIEQDNNYKQIYGNTGLKTYLSWKSRNYHVFIWILEDKITIGIM